MNTRHVAGVVLAATVAALLVVGPVSALPLHQPPDYKEIAGTPLRIQIGSNASVQVYHENYTYGAAYGSGASGPFFAIGEDVYGPQVPAGNYVNPLSSLSHEGPSGTGTGSDPLRIVTTQRLRSSGADLAVVQTVSYVNGNNYFQLDWRITNEGGERTCFKFYHAADLYFADDDYGIGYYDANSGAIGGFNQERNWYMVFVPLTPADHYKEAGYSTIWNDISAAADLDDTIDTDYIDNGAALQWNICLQPGETTAVSDLWSFGESEAEVIPPEVAPPERGAVDVWLKDSPEDDGTVPSTRNNAAWWTSPDIWVRNEPDGGDAHQNPIRGRDNAVYVLIRNRGTEHAQNVVVNVYYADANVLNPFWPDRFNLVGSTTIDVPAGGTVRTDPIAWEPPVSGHLCLLVRLESSQDPIRAEGDVPGDNNIAQRNVHGVELERPLFGSTGSGSLEAILIGPPDSAPHDIDLIVNYPNRPPSLNIYIVLPPDLFARWQDAGGTLGGGETEGERIRATGENETVIGGLPLEPGEEAGVQLEIEGPTEEPFAFGVVGRMDGEDMGGNVYVYEGLVPSGPGGGRALSTNILLVAAGLCCVGLLGAIILVGVVLFVRRRGKD